MMRRYSALWARFSQPDPYDGSYDLTDPQSFNRYSYAQNDPVNFTDPTGLDGFDGLDEDVVRIEAWTWRWIEMGGGGKRDFEVQQYLLADVGLGSPQNPAPQPPPDVPGIRSELERMLKDPKCADFIKDLLGRIVSDNNPLVEGGDIVKIFNLINSPAQGGMVRAGASGSMQGIGYGGNYALGSVGTGDARIQIGTSYPGLPTARSDAGTALHETIHHAGRNVYSDQVLAEAVSAMTRRAITRHDGAPLTGDPHKDVGIYSTFRGTELRNRCK